MNVGTRSKTQVKWADKRNGLPSQKVLKRWAMERAIDNDPANNIAVAVGDARYNTALANFYATQFDEHDNPTADDGVFSTEYCFPDQFEDYQGDTGIDEDVAEADFDIPYNTASIDREVMEAMDEDTGRFVSAGEQAEVTHLAKATNRTIIHETLMHDEHGELLFEIGNRLIPESQLDVARIRKEKPSPRYGRKTT